MLYVGHFEGLVRHKEGGGHWVPSRGRSESAALGVCVRRGRSESAALGVCVRRGRSESAALGVCVTHSECCQFTSAARQYPVGVALCHCRCLTCGFELRYCSIFREISCISPLNIGTVFRCCVFGQGTSL